MPTVLKSGSLNLLEPSGPVHACNGIALSFIALSFIALSFIALSFIVLSFISFSSKEIRNKAPEDRNYADGTREILLLLLLSLQPTVGFSLLNDFLPFCPFFTLLSPPSYSHYLQIFFNAFNPSLPWSPSSSRTYRFPL